MPRPISGCDFRWYGQQWLYTPSPYTGRCASSLLLRRYPERDELNNGLVTRSGKRLMRVTEPLPLLPTGAPRFQITSVVAITDSQIDPYLASRCGYVWDDLLAEIETAWGCCAYPPLYLWRIDVR